jgi:hypothetical protein
VRGFKTGGTEGGWVLTNEFSVGLVESKSLRALYLSEDGIWGCRVLGRGRGEGRVGPLESTWGGRVVVGGGRKGPDVTLGGRVDVGGGRVGPVKSPNSSSRSRMELGVETCMEVGGLPGGCAETGRLGSREGGWSCLGGNGGGTLKIAL